MITKTFVGPQMFVTAMANDPSSFDVDSEVVREIKHIHQRMHLIGGTHPFDREVERVAGYPCFADSDGGECD